MVEELIVLYNVPHELPLGILIATYFYYTGVSAGSFVLSTLAYVFGYEKYKPIGKLAIVMAVIVLILAPLHLILDLAQPQRFVHILYMFNARSMISWGTIMLTAYPLNCVIYGYFMFKENMKMTRIFGLIGIPLAVGVHGYCGFILSLVAIRSLWHTALMPPLFLVSAVVSGVALMILIVITKQRFFTLDKKINVDLIFSLGKILAWTLVLDLFLVGVDLLELTYVYSRTEAYDAAMLLIKGPLAPLFLIGEIFLGGIVPFILLTHPRTSSSIKVVTLASVLVLIGIYAMRVNWVVGGQMTPLS
ncbi:polysulfide reductase NrfD [Candidatus Woesearchaeota archaeon]|nr:polysulfide reductase NrfD [Candidatus Woesearchaeota archaeon]